VLVVDDSTIMRRNLSAILSNAGHTIVAEAPDGELGVKEYKKRKPDLVTMDITMPILDGISAVKQIMAIDPEAQIVMISSLDQKFMVLTALQNGARHYIIKPFTPEKVLKVIDDVLNTSKSKHPSDDEGKKLKAPSNGQKNSLGAINTTISNISFSIDNINNAIKELDTES
ncbi:MAG TPA: response regulator, partial [Clostridia bacterium]|nr:response regulator [Clostridia bacterium]